MEGSLFVPKAMLTGGKLAKVLCGIWESVVVELENDTTSGLAVDGDI